MSKKKEKKKEVDMDAWISEQAQDYEDGRKPYRMLLEDLYIYNKYQEMEDSVRARPTGDDTIEFYGMNKPTMKKLKKTLSKPFTPKLFPLRQPTEEELNSIMQTPEYEMLTEGPKKPKAKGKKKD